MSEDHGHGGVRGREGLCIVICCLIHQIEYPWICARTVVLLHKDLIALCDETIQKGKRRKFIITDKARVKRTT